MERPDPEPGQRRSWPVGEDTLRNLESRLDRASEAAERLLAEAAARAGARGAAPEPPAAQGSADRDPGEAPPREPPPAGWQVPDAGDAATGSGRDLELLIGLIGSIRDLIPPELQQRLAEALRELLLALRALIDWYLERAERRRSAPSDVEDIPIQ